MPRIYVFKIALCLALSAVFFLLSVILLDAFAPVHTDNSLPQNGVSSTQNVDTPYIRPPSRLKIEAIGIDAAVKPVGITSQGDMAIDKSITDVAWYMKGPKPGEEGSAVIAGHYGWKDGVASVFNDIQTLKKGDKILVYDEKGSLVTFTMKRVKRYNPKEDTAEVFLSHDNKSHLNLITCVGSWNNVLQTYSERLVVFADKEP